ncbi:MAG: HAD-IA family hydrolase [Anaeromyxobacter sp.]
MPVNTAVLFDLDGTLVDTIPFILAAVRHAFEGHPRGPTEAEWLAGVGTPLREQIARLVPAHEVDGLVDRYRQFWLAEHDRMTRCFPGALETVASLAAAGHPLGVVTAKTEQGAFRTLRFTGLLPHLRVVIGADSCARSKPDPEPVLLALERLGVPAADAIMVGDAVHDLEAARAAGVATVAAPWGACERAVLLGAGPDHVLERIEDLPALLAALRDPSQESQRLPSRVPGSRPTFPAVNGPARVLVVDDNDVQRDVVADVLSAEGYQVQVAADGEEGLARLRADPPDVLVLDLMMPGLDGASLLNTLRADPALARIRVVVTTGIQTPHVTRLLKPDAVLFKPFGLRELLRAVADAAERGRPGLAP